MKTLNLSGFTQGDDVSLSVSQNALTAGPLTVPAWGGGGDGGTITIVAQQSVTRLAPESVRFSVDLSASLFDAVGPVGDEVYDARLHDQIYLWSYGDPGTWSGPVNVLSQWTNKNVGKGPEVAHVFRAPKPSALGAGNGYTASVMVIEPSSGRVANDSIELFVEDPDEYYAGADTICVNPVGDSDFMNAPTGSVSINANSLWTNAGTGDANWEAHKDVATPKRWLFKRGGTYDVSFRLWGPDAPRLTFGAYGAGAAPIFTNKTDGGAYTNEWMISWTESWGGGVGEHLTPPEFRMSGINLTNDFNPIAELSQTENPSTALYVNSDFHIVLDDCTFNGFGNVSIYAQTGNTSLSGRMHLNDCVVTNFGGQYTYMCVGSTNADSYVAATGSRLALPGDAIANSGGTRSIMRLQQPLIYVAGCDLFHTATGYHHIKAPDTPLIDGYLVNIHSNSFEGGKGALVMNSNPTVTPRNSPYVNNLIFDGNIVVGSWSMDEPVGLIGTGATVRNNLFINPAVQKLGNLLGGMVAVRGEATIVQPPGFVSNAPVNVYSNTFRVDQNMTQLGSDYQPVAIYNVSQPTWFLNLNEANNVLHFPNLVVPSEPSSPMTDFAPLSEVSLWVPRNLGYRNNSDRTLDVQYATPVGALKDTKPLTGSAALGAALTGDVSYDDLGGTVRTAPADQGAWEAA